MDLFSSESRDESALVMGCSPERVDEIEELIDAIESNNLKIVGQGVYSTSGHNNQSLVSTATSIANAALADLSFDCSDENLVEALIAQLEQRKTNFDDNHYDPDGVGAGTLMDIILKLKNLDTGTQNSL